MTILLMTIFLAQSPPKINDWEQITQIHYEVKNTAKFGNKNIIATSIVGTLKIFKNPELQDEFIFVISKSPALTFSPQPAQGGENSSDEIIVAENYFKKTKKDRLKEVDLTSDVILFIRWRESKDQRTGEKILLGPIKNWLINSNGEWVFEESVSPLIKIELISEGGTLVGFKFSLGKNYHILRFDQDQLGGEK